MKSKINVTETYLPPLSEYIENLQKIWESKWVTNHGPHVQELEKRLKEYLHVKHLSVVNNATIGLQIALQVLDVDGEVITTPFTYIASTSSIIWHKSKPVFVDIDPHTLCIDADKIESAITNKTKAILAVHVYGIPCNVEKIQKIAKKYKLKVIYDAAHAFGVKYKDRPLLHWGDVSILSFHATKLFHTIEGGALIAKNKKLQHKIAYSRNFGHKGYDKEYYGVGINGKTSELHAAIGLAVLPKVQEIIQKRKEVSEKYDLLLKGLRVTKPYVPRGVDYNYAYYPVLFDNERALLRVKKALNEQRIFPRRYFYPSLSTVSYIKKVTGNKSCAIAENVSRRVLCLPLYVGLKNEDQIRIIEVMKKSL